MKIGLVLVNYNDSKRTIKAYFMFKKFSNISNIVIVDNNSDEYNKSELINSIPTKNLIFNSRNYGYSKGNNIGIKFLNSLDKFQWIAISNSDVEIEENNFNVLYDYLSTTDYSMLTGVMHDSNNRVSSMVYWRKTKFIDDLLSNFWLLRKFVKKYNYEGINFPSNEIKSVYAIPGSFFLINNTIFESINYFDENVFLFHEEDILAHKLNNKNKKVGVVLNCKFIHNHKSSVMSPKLFKYYLASKSYYQKYYNKINTFKYLLLVISNIYSFLEHYLIYIFLKNRTLDL